MQCKCGGTYQPICVKCDYSGWKDVNVDPPLQFERVLVLKKYLDCEWDMVNGGYNLDKTFWTDPIVEIDILWGTCWDKGGDVTHWMELPRMPNE